MLASGPVSSHGAVVHSERAVLASVCHGLGLPLEWANSVCVLILQDLLQSSVQGLCGGSHRVAAAAAHGVCVGCLFLRTPSRVPSGTPSACANRAAYPDPPPRSPRPRIHRRPGGLPWTAQHYCPFVSGPNCFQALGSSPGLPQSPML